MDSNQSIHFSIVMIIVEVYTCNYVERSYHATQASNNLGLILGLIFLIEYHLCHEPFPIQD